MHTTNTFSPPFDGSPFPVRRVQTEPIQQDQALIWILAVIGGLIGLYFLDISAWIPVGFCLVGLVTGHLLVSTRTHFPLPHAAVLIASLYYIVAPLISIYFPPPNHALYYFKGNPGTYFSYAIPCICCLAAGWSVAFSGTRLSFLTNQIRNVDPRLTSGLDILLYAGLAVTLVSSFSHGPMSIRFVITLLGNLRFIGAFGWMLLGTEGWKKRFALVMIIELYRATSLGFFLDFALTCLSAGVIVIARYRPSKKVLAAAVIGAVLFLPCIQYAKWEFRKSTWRFNNDEQYLAVFGNNFKLTRFNKPFLLIAKTAESSTRLLRMDQVRNFICETTLRYNQGWIVDRIILQVPRREPYAGGSTIKSAIIASIFPRFVLPNKMKSGGSTLFTRFTGVRINSTTSMNLGFVGEMYANFGYYGGIIGCGVYGLFLGTILRILLKTAESRPLVMSFIPFVLNFAVVSEVGLLEVLNYTMKSLMFIFVFYWIFPGLFMQSNPPAASRLQPRRSTNSDRLPHSISS